MKLNEITIEITQQCPNHCIYCSSLSCPDKTTCLTTEKVIEVIDDAVALGCESINLSGGEPFMHPGLEQIVNHITKKGVQCQIYTSGIIFEDGDPQSIPVKILEKLKGRVSKYIVNVEAADEEIYDKIMRTSFHGFAMMKQFISAAVAMGEILEAHFVPMKLNYQQIPSVVKMCSELGVSKISFLRFVAQGRGFENRKTLMLDRKESLLTKKLMKQCVEQNVIGVRLGIPYSDFCHRVNCLTGSAKLNIRYDGNVYPCEAFKNDQLEQIIKVPVDSVVVERLIDIYPESQYLAKVRDEHKKYLEFNTCETCFAQFLSNKNQ